MRLYTVDESAIILPFIHFRCNEGLYVENELKIIFNGLSIDIVKERDIERILLNKYSFLSLKQDMTF